MDQKHYELYLPVFKQGDDFDYHKRNADNVAEAFKRLAKQYEEAAQICNRVAGVIAECKDKHLIVDGCTHSISIQTSDEYNFEGLVADDILSVCEFDEEDWVMSPYRVGEEREAPFW